MSKRRNYNLSLSEEVYHALQKIADEEDLTLADLLRKCTRFYLLVRTVIRESNAKLLIEQDGRIREL